MERSASFAYFKNKHDAILKCLDYLDRFETRFVAKFQQEERDNLAQACNDPVFAETVQNDWLAYNHNEVKEHFPPQVIIGKQTGDESEFLVYDADPHVRVSITEVPCEYNYSNPTGLFNLSIPHVELRLNMYSTLSYKQQKKNEYDEERKARQE